MFIAISYSEAGLHSEARQWFEKARELGLSAMGDRLEYIYFLARLGEVVPAMDLLEYSADRLDEVSRLRIEAQVLAWAGRASDAKALFANWSELRSAQSDGPRRDIAETLARWLPLKPDYPRRSELDAILRSSIAHLLEAGVEAVDRTDVLHEVAIRLLALGEKESGLMWLKSAIEQGWVNYEQTVAEPAVRALSKETPELADVLAKLSDQQSSLARHLQGGPPDLMLTMQ